MNGRSPFPTVLEPAAISTVGGSPPFEPAQIIGDEPILEPPKDDEKDKEPIEELPPVAVAPKTGEVRCLAKLSRFEGTTLKPDRSGKCKECLKKLVHADRCY